MKKLSFILMALLVAGVVFHGCKKDETAVAPPVPGNEFLTTVQLIVTSSTNPNDIDTVQVKQLPDQPIDYSRATLNLKANSVYNVSVKFLDETTTPPGDVTQDIYDRRNYHLICFETTTVNLSVKRTDKDTNNPPLEIGLEDQFTTGAASSGSLNVQLRHQPNAKNGSCAPGSSDADVDFPVVIK